MTTATGDLSHDEKLLDRLNQLSLSRSFIPEVDIDWNAVTTDAEYESLYSSWSLLEGTGIDTSLDAGGRSDFVRYQQMNLMIFTGLLERYGVTALTGLYDLDASEAFSEYVGHFIKEETYHYTMFMRGVRKIQASMTGRRPIPTRRLRWILRWVFGILNGLPGRRFRTNVALRFFRYAEQISIYAYQMVHDKIPRRDSLLHQIWGCHAMDESRHLAFDAMILERNRACWAWAWIPHLLAALCSTLLSLSLNANEVWAARQLGLRVSLWQLPWLMRRTKAPFKRRVFGLLARAIMGQEAAAR